MRRAPELTPLSHDHHQALEAALRLRRATPDDLDAALARLEAFWEAHGARHFVVEERLFTPELCNADPRWTGAVARMRAEHADLRRRIATVDDVAGAHVLGCRLRDHVRFEERELFGIVEATLPREALARLGTELAD